MPSDENNYHYKIRNDFPAAVYPTHLQHAKPLRITR